jgi:Zn-dependent peptidase ImmA (M78 family)
MSISYSDGNDITSEQQARLTRDQATNLIIQRTKELTNQLIEKKGYDNPPFLAEEYARLMGIKKITKTELGDVGGVLLRFYDGPEIRLNQDDLRVRQSFSLAHEIGHLLYSELKLERYIRTIEYRSYYIQDCEKTRVKEKEHLCDVAATELLMPELIFKRHLSNFKLSMYSIERMAEIFKVSVQTTAIRVAELSTEPCIILLWRPQQFGKKTLRIIWRVGPGRQLRSRNYYMPIHSECPLSVRNAYENDGRFRCYKLFKLDKSTKRLPVESKGFGFDENRYVISLAFINSEAQ